MKTNTQALLIVAIGSFLVLLSCSKSSNQPCEVSGGNGCLPTMTVNAFFEYKDGAPTGGGGGGFPGYYSYDGRQLSYYYPPTGPKYVPYVQYLYTNCSQLIETRSGNSASTYSPINISRYSYNDDGSIARVEYSDWWKQNNKRTPTGYAKYRYADHFRAVYYFDTASVLQGYDSIMLFASGEVKEKWKVMQTVALQYVYNHPGNAKSSVAHMGDKLSYYSNNALQFTETTDSVYYNQYGYDTLSYAGRKDPSGVFLGISKWRKSYTGCQ
jgi:hypothetical protein